MLCPCPFCLFPVCFLQTLFFAQLDLAMPGWYQLLDEGSGEYYYWNEDTGDVQWEIPDDYNQGESGDNEAVTENRGSKTEPNLDADQMALIQKMLKLLPPKKAVDVEIQVTPF